MVLEMFPGLKLMLGVEREPSHIIAVAIATAPKPSKVTLVPSFGFPQFKKLLRNCTKHQNFFKNHAAVYDYIYYCKFFSLFFQNSARPRKAGS